ncbi:MAG: radical SAM protein [Deltaproteobacteria bacterium]|nr:radical SAM protein [Deltaproteobacteria bacterium]
MKVALITPFLSHLPLHPSSYLGYGAAILRKRYELEIIDLNAHIYFKSREGLKEVLSAFDKKPVVVDNSDLYPHCDQLTDTAEKELKQISWKDYQTVFITTPSWFTTIPTEDILKLSNLIKRESHRTEIVFFANSLGSWTEEGRLVKHGIRIGHLNDLFNVNPGNEPVKYDTLPAPVYENREKYLFDLLPFRMKHGCTWGKCRFCSLARGWNSGYLERSGKAIIQEMEELIDRYNPKMLVCRDNSINGNNLLEFCSHFEKFKKPWVGMARADLSAKEIQALQKSGCKFIYFGLESGSDRVLSEINKGIDTRQMSHFIRELYDHGIMPAPSVFVGTPGETEDDFEKTVQFISDHKDFVEIINLYPLMITPGSDFSITKEEPNTKALIRLNTLIRVCRDIGIKTCVGAQCAEYLLFKRVYPNQDHNSTGYG